MFLANAPLATCHLKDPQPGDGVQHLGSSRAPFPQPLQRAVTGQLGEAMSTTIWQVSSSSVTR
jgi:hypothetical protein